jgi:hypothetical protein
MTMLQPSDDQHPDIPKRLGLLSIILSRAVAPSTDFPAEVNRQSIFAAHPDTYIS